MTDIFSRSLSTIIAGQALELSQAQELLTHLPQKLTALIATAGIANQSAKPFTCAVINAKSGHCTEDCAFCAQSLYCNTNSTSHNLLSEEVLYKQACLIHEKGIDRIGFVTSGGAPTAADFEKLCLAAERIIKSTNLKICASFGILNDNQAKSLAQAGYHCYHHNLETARSYFPSICTTHSYDLRENTVRLAKANGLRTCSGCLFGMGESWTQRLELCEALQKLNVDSIPINFLMPIAGTRMENANALKAQDALIIISLMRLMNPHKDIVICGGRGYSLEEWDRSIFFAGANGLMVGDYLTTKGSSFERDLEILATLGIHNTSQNLNVG